MENAINVDAMLKSHLNHKNVSLFEHFANVVEKLQQTHKKGDAFADFEKLSDFLQKTQFHYKVPKKDSEVNKVKEKTTELTKYIESSISFLKKHTSGKTIPKSVAPANLPTLSNTLFDQRLFQMAGVSFGEEEVYKVTQSLKELIKTTQAKNVRLWGKMLGTKKDYWVAEGEINYDTAEPLPLPFESFGKGVNALTYWVTTNPLKGWKELPPISPAHLQIAKQTKHFLTGKLNHKVDVYPPFPGVEKHYLKAQIVRISYGSVIAPKDLYKTNDDDATKIEFSEEFTMPAWDDLKSIENWVHLHPNILEAGRVSHLEPEVGPDQDKDEIMNKLNDTDPVKSRLAPLNEDNPFPGFETNWLVRTYGDQQVFNMTDKDEGKTAIYGCVVLKSLTWPGSLTVAQGNTWAHLYVGYGFKSGSLPLNPMAPNDVMGDLDEQDEQYEPNPKNPPPEPLEPDSDEERKKREAAENGEELQEDQ